MAAPGSSYSLKWHGHGGHLNSSIFRLYSSEAFTDVTLATTDGRCVSGHQFVLSACSPYLHKLFLVASSGSKTGSKLVVILPPDIGHSTLSILLRYIYQGEVIVSHDQLPGIMKAAEILQIKGLCQGREKSDPKFQLLANFAEHARNDPSKLDHRVLIPEVSYSSDHSNESVNSVSVHNKNQKRTNSRIQGSSSPAPERKKHKDHNDKSVSDLNIEKNTSVSSIEESMIEKIIVAEEISVKEEPIDWDEEEKLAVEGNAIKQELEELAMEEESCYVPLTCDLCQETFTTPALWVRHIEETHPTTALAGKRGYQADGSSSEEFPPLHCELCQQVFLVPAEWVRHIQSHSHSEPEMSSPADSTARGRVECDVCGKVLQSQASMAIHMRKHTGERPYLCKLCGREFNVKSNFLRHLRTLHDQIVCATTVD